MANTDHAAVTADNRDLEEDLSSSPPEPLVQKRPKVRKLFRTRNSIFNVVVEKAVLKSIGSQQVEFYEVSIVTDFDGFDQDTIEVQRRFSEFHTLRKVLAQKGVEPPPLSRIRWIPRNLSRWQELNIFCESTGKLSRKWEEGALEELRRFFQDPSPYMTFVPDKSTQA